MFRFESVTPEEMLEDEEWVAVRIWLGAKGSDNADPKL